MSCAELVMAGDDDDGDDGAGGEAAWCCTGMALLVLMEGMAVPGYCDVHPRGKVG